MTRLPRLTTLIIQPHYGKSGDYRLLEKQWLNPDERKGTYTRTIRGYYQSLNGIITKTIDQYVERDLNGDCKIQIAVSHSLDNRDDIKEQLRNNGYGKEFR